MEKPVTVIGWERLVNEETGKVGIRVYGTRPIVGSEDCAGEEAIRIYYNPEYCKYVPQLGQKIIAIQGRYGVDRIIVVD